MSLPIAPVVYPTVLSGQLNGRLAPELLVNIHPRGQLLRQVARQWEALVFAAKVEAKFNYTFTYGGCYRPYADQYSLFMQRYEPVSYLKYSLTPSSRRKKWSDSPTKQYYWIKKRFSDGSYPATAAVPGTSNHGWGMAIDTALDRDPSDGLGPDDAVSIHPATEWNKKNIHRFGFSFESQDEEWHIRSVCGDATPAEVQRYFDTLKLPVLRLGSKGDFVKWIQGKMNMGTENMDGIFGPKTLAEVKNYQVWWGLAPTGVVDAAFWWMINR